MQEHTTVVIGGYGKTGRRVARILQEAGVPVRAVSRSSEVPFDWTRPDGWAKAMKDATSAYITYQPDLAVEGAAAQIAELARVGIDAGVQQFVLLSGRGEPGALKAETALANSGAAWGVVRAGWFNQNFSEAFLCEFIRAGRVRLPVGDVREPFVDAEDVAEVAAGMLLGKTPDGRVYEVTGPDALTFAEAVDAIGSATGRKMVFEEISAADFVGDLARSGMPCDYQDVVLELFTTVLDGRNSHVTAGVQEALGRAPRDFATFARTAAVAGAWDS